MWAGLDVVSFPCSISIVANLMSDSNSASASDRFRFVRQWFLLLGFLVILVGSAAILQLNDYRRSKKADLAIGKVMRCRMKLKAIMAAMHIYNKDRGVFPPAYIADKSGRPTHSWRVLLLPYLEREDPVQFQGATELHDAYDFTQAWNSQSNLGLAPNFRNFYAAPHREQDGAMQTNYLAVVGDATAWRGSTGVAISEFVDGTSETVVLMEVVDSSIHWMTPEDLSLDEALEWYSRSLDDELKHGHFYMGFHVAYADGSVDFLHRLWDGWKSKEEFRDLLTISNRLPTVLE